MYFFMKQWSPGAERSHSLTDAHNISSSVGALLALKECKKM